jgi:hypothetical protein
MKVVCIANIEDLYITKGKIYDVYREVNSEYVNFYEVKNDMTYVGLIKKEYFKDIREVRERRINQILD